MKNFLRTMVKYLLLSFLVSVTIYSLSGALLSGNFTQAMFPEAKDLVSYHLWPSSTPAVASNIPTNKIGRTSSAFWLPDSKDNGNCLFLIMWGLCFFYLLFAKYSGLADTGYVFPSRFLYHRKGRREIEWGN